VTGAGVEEVLVGSSTTAVDVAALGVAVIGTVMVITVGEYPLGQTPEFPRRIKGLAETVAAPPRRAKPKEAMF
jgi:hypothetical protein